MPYLWIFLLATFLSVSLSPCWSLLEKGVLFNLDDDDWGYLFIKIRPWCLALVALVEDHSPLTWRQWGILVDLIVAWSVIMPSYSILKGIHKSNRDLPLALSGVSRKRRDGREVGTQH